LEDSLQIVIQAKNFAHEKHRNQKRKDNITPFVDHLEKVVNRLKNLGVSDHDILSAAWLHDTIEYTDTTFEEINQIFGNTISVIVLSLTKDLKLAKKERELQYIQQLKNSTLQAKLIKFCDVSANLKDISNSPISKTQKNKQVKKLFHYMRIIKKEISENKSDYPKIQEHIDGINAVGAKFRQRPISF
jgi:guanosine-3',5'-bis(diphosphate) 3'-pyrophosphohydrolase